MNIPWDALAKSHNARVFLLLKFIGNMWFVEAVWYFYWGRFLSYTQIGMVFSLLTLVGLIAEVPSGFFADKFGRRVSVIVGNLLLGIGGVGMASSQNGIWLIVSCVIMSIGRAFISGALDALVYDDLKRVRRAYLFDKLSAFGTQIAFGGFLIAVPLGGFLYTNHFRLPNTLEAITAFVAVVVAYNLKEVRVISNKTERPEGLLIGFRELMLPNLRPFIIPVVICISTYLLYDWGLSKPAMATNFGLDSRGQSIAYTLFAIINIVAISWMPRIRRWLGDYRGIRFINMFLGIAFMASTLALGIYGLGIMIVIETMGNFGDPWTGAIVNDHVGSKYRATTLSTLALLTRIPHFFVNILAGSAIDGSGINPFHLGLGLVILLITLLSTNYKKIFLANK